MSLPALITLDRVSYALPQGTPLFTELSLRLDACPTALIGQNGVGKTLLAELIAGRRAPDSGHIERTVSTCLLTQWVSPEPHACVADVLGVRTRLAALARIEAGGARVSDFEEVGDQWMLRSELKTLLAQHALAQIGLETPATQLSGGECARLALAGAFLSGADYLILDEPTNHLDAFHRQAFLEQLAQWKSGFLIISHDREVLDTMARIIELNAAGLTCYGGNFTFYQAQQRQQQAAALAALEHARLERKRTTRALQQADERLARRNAQGKRERQNSNQAKILLDAQQARSQRSSGRIRQQHDAMRTRHADAVEKAAQQFIPERGVVLHAPAARLPENQTLCVLDEVILPFGPHPRYPITLTVRARQRIALCGPNGCGKSTLLKLLAGLLGPDAGTCAMRVDAAYLDQHVSCLAPDTPVIAQLRTANPSLDEGSARSRLALLGLGAEQVLQPAGRLSGGESIKAALACILYAARPASLLLLDEPGNHLDLSAQAALETMLGHYQGAFIVVSHNPHLLASLALTDTLSWTPDGWKLNAEC